MVHAKRTCLALGVASLPPAAEPNMPQSASQRVCNLEIIEACRPAPCGCRLHLQHCVGPYRYGSQRCGNGARVSSQDVLRSERPRCARLCTACSAGRSVCGSGWLTADCAAAGCRGRAVAAGAAHSAWAARIMVTDSVSLRGVQVRHYNQWASTRPRGHSICAVRQLAPCATSPAIQHLDVLLKSPLQ